VKQLRGRNALITGAGGGLGQFIARSLAAEGVNLVLTDTTATPLDDRLAEAQAAGVKASGVPADLTDTAALEDLIAAAAAAHGPLDILVNNAGIEFVGPYTSQTRAQLEAIVSVNLLAVLELTRLVLPGMLDRDRGHVVNIASLAGKLPAPYFHTYNATKHGVVGFTHAIRGELAETPVSASAICPGFINRVGMLGRIEDRVNIPPALGTLPPEKVGAAVVRAIRKDVPEVIVNKRPVRPIIALAAVFPGAAQKLTRRIGATDYALEMAKAEGRI
jgi:short-subunit dehydrogenase